MATPPIVSDDTVYVAVGKDEKESNYTIDWALKNSVEKILCILHIHTPAQKIPLKLGGNFGISLTNEHEARAYHEKERRDTRNFLNKYLLMCGRAGAQVKLLCVEKDNIEKGIVDIISDHGIKKLVIGAAAYRYYSRQCIPERLNVAIASSPPLGTSQHASEGETNEVDIVGALPELQSVQSVNIRINLSGPPSSSTRKGLSSFPSSSCTEENTYELYGTLRRMLSLESHHSSLSSGNDSHSVALCDHCHNFQANAPETMNAEEVLARSKEEIEQMNMMVQKFEQNMISTDELLLKYKKERDDLAVERDNALRAAECMSKKLDDKEASSSSAQFYAVFSSSEIKEATLNFDPKLKVGNGGYGSVYRGKLRHTPVAIKILNPDSIQGPSEFHQEVNILSKVRHPNLVTLIGACPETFVLVYEYLPNGSLDDCINNKGNTPPLTWQTRIRIAAELRSALIFIPTLMEWSRHCSW